jgi:hypothetical protein
VSARSIIEADTYRSLLTAMARDYDARIGRTVSRTYFEKFGRRLEALRGLTPNQNQKVQALLDYIPAATYDPSTYRELVRSALQAP